MQYDNGSTAEMFDANFAQFSPSISASHLVMRYVGAGCPGDTPLPGEYEEKEDDDDERKKDKGEEHNDDEKKNTKGHGGKPPKE